MRVLVLFLVTTMALISLYNFATIYRPKRSTHAGDRIAVLVPMRNEEAHVEGLIDSLKAQVGIPQAHFYILDDGSRDRTRALLDEATDGDERFTILQGKTLPDGWLGKPWALAQLEAASSGEVIVTVDADVRLQPHAIASATTLLMTSDLDFISPYPQQIAGTLAEKLIQPLVHWTWIASLPLRFAARSRRPSMAVANGQLFLVKRAALSSVGGFGAVAAEVLDDVMLARALMRGGFRGTAAEGASIAATRMYSSFSDIKQGYGKSLWKAFGGKFGPYVAIALIFFTSIYPFINANELYGLILSFYILLTRLVSAVIAREKIRYIFLHPISAALFIYLIAYSLINHSRITWKDRSL